MSLIGKFVISVPNIDINNDTASWQFVFESDTAPNWAGVGPVLTHCANFLTTAGTGGTNALGTYLGLSVDRNTNHCFVTAYDITAHLNGTPHGSPVATSTFSLPGSLSGAAVLPEGVAAAISFRSDYGTDVEFGSGTRPRARDRNRVYLGPLNTKALSADPTTERAELSSQFITDCLAALFNLSETVTAGSDLWNFRVWTRAGAAVKLPTEGFMDNRPDYQRRRSDPAPGSRVFRALSSV